MYVITHGNVQGLVLALGGHYTITLPLFKPVALAAKINPFVWVFMTFLSLSRYGTTLTSTRRGYVTCRPTTANRIGEYSQFQSTKRDQLKLH